MTWQFLKLGRLLLIGDTIGSGSRSILRRSGPRGLSDAVRIGSRDDFVYVGSIVMILLNSKTYISYWYGGHFKDRESVKAQRGKAPLSQSHLSQVPEGSKK